jgi:hypothetical protein
MNRWFRVYDEALDDPKVQRLPAEYFKLWFNTLCVASRHGGVLPPIEDLAFLLRMRVDEVVDGIKWLENAGLIEGAGNGERSPHNWLKRQFQSDSSTERVKRFRNARRNVAETSTETPPESESESESESEKKKKETRAGARFDRFWNVWPNKVQKPYAAKCFAKVADHIDAIVDGVERYVREKPADRPWLNPSTFLNQRRWEDKPAPVGEKHGKGSVVTAGRKLTERLVEQQRQRELQSGPGFGFGDETVRLLPGVRGK